MGDKEIPRCDVCGKPATSFARDVYQLQKFGESHISSMPGDFVRLGCDEHPAKSNVIDMGSEMYPAGW